MSTENGMFIRSKDIAELLTRFFTAGVNCGYWGSDKKKVFKKVVKKHLKKHCATIEQYELIKQEFTN